MEYGQTSKELEEEYEEESEKVDPRKNYRNSLLPHFRFGVRLPDSMEGLGGKGFGFRVPASGTIIPAPYKLKIPKSGKMH